MSGPPVEITDPVCRVLRDCDLLLDDEGIACVITSLQGVLRRRREGRSLYQQAKREAGAATKRQKREAWRVIEGCAR
jgi:hypothetical protein